MILPTEEITCTICKKPYTFTPVAPTQIKSNGCSCNPPREPAEIPAGAELTSFGGIWVIRRPKIAA
jgi:hypothetical protein